jgi:carbamoyl-phosphate synthase large subunit
MKSVGEVMAIGRTFKQALWKGIRSLETGKAFGSEKLDKALIAKKLITPTPDRLSYIRFALANGYSVEEIHELTAIDPWFLTQMKDVVDYEGALAGTSLMAATQQQFRTAKRYGISDAQLAKSWGPRKSTCATGARNSV